ncbi:ThiF family adenylyltransferase [bacterium]|nr:ThiF family adenylyltransferase [bacterium]MBU1428353.1 ThiF family adenylyltransferase [bacterium]MBU2439728.1 ThiF family adenylyltransferase [bacterium]
MQDRYSRQVILPNIGEEGQKTLLKSKIAIIGCGALGTVVANNLVRAGVGKISIIDRDFVELNNLQRQILFDEDDIGIPKAVAAAEKLKRVNSDVEIEAMVKDLNHMNAEKIMSDVDLVLDGTDNMQTRFLINDVCVKSKIPWIYTAAVGTYGMMMTIVPGRTPCFRCFLPDVPEPGSLPTCDTAGILNTISAIIASIESTEAIKILLKENITTNAESNLIFYDVWSNTFEKIAVMRDKRCRCCVEHKFDFLNAAKKEIITSLCGRNAIQITPAKSADISFKSLAERLKRSGEVRFNNFILVFKERDKEISLFKDGRAIIKGTDDEKVARSLYARYVGI